MRVGSWIACAALASALGCSFGEEVGEGRRAEESAPPAASSLDPASLHREAIVVDTHADTTAFFADEEWNFGERHDAAETHVDLPRMREGGLDVEFWSIYVGAREQPGAAMRAALQRIDAVHRMVERHPETTALAGTVADVRRIVAEGRIASLMGIEGGHMIEDDLAVLRSFFRLGARYMTLTHSFHTSWADSSGTRAAPAPGHGGLTAFGEEVVREMNRLGMMVDVSHVSDETFDDVLRTTQAPVIASHSSCRALADHRRNMSDAMLAALAQNGGVVMINFYPAYIDEQAARATQAYFAEHGEVLKAIRERQPDDPAAQRDERQQHFARYPVPRTSLAVLVDHFDHAIRVAGPKHVGIGADWDGVPSMPEQMSDVSALPGLTSALLARGHSPDVVRGVLGENLLRVMGRVEAVAATLQAEATRLRSP